MRRDIASRVLLAGVIALAATACAGSDKSVESTRSSQSDASQSEASAGSNGNGASPLSPENVVVDGEVDPAKVKDGLAAFAALPIEEQYRQAAELNAQVEREAWTWSGLEAQVGGAAAADEAFADAATVSAAYGESWRGASLDPAGATPLVAPSGLRSSGFRSPVSLRTPAAAAATPAAPAAPEGANIGGSLFGGLIIVSLVGDGMVVRTNDGTEIKGSAPIEADPASSNRADMSLDADRSQVSMSSEFVHKSSTGVETRLNASMKIAPCPGPDGTYVADAKLDMSGTAAAGSVGQKGTLDLELIGYVDDDAKPAGRDVSFRMQWADFANSKGQFFDVTGNWLQGQDPTATSNRAGGAITQSFANATYMLGLMFALMMASMLESAAQKGWESGRCVKLEPTVSAGPKSLKPSAEVTITAAPRSQIDGAAVGGTVTAKLTGGGTSVAPSDTKVKADATFNYVAPDEKNKTGTVALEARSKRGVAKATIEFDTKVASAYVIVGGLEDFQVNQTVCNVLEPFTLNSSVGTMQLSGGLTGTYEFNGVFASTYTGTYTITLPDDPNAPGTMVGGGGGQIAGQGGSGTEKYTLTPTTC